MSAQQHPHSATKHTIVHINQYTTHTFSIVAWIWSGNAKRKGRPKGVLLEHTYAAAGFNLYGSKSTNLQL
jgi:hypothetical protein